jgi:hypothetical protein
MESLLDRCQCFTFRQPFDSYNGLLLTIDCQCQAGQDRSTVYQNRAGTALTGSAGLLGTGQTHLVSNNFSQGGVGRYGQFAGYTINAEFNQSFHPNSPDRLIYFLLY